jgi:hypothetical protein
VVITLAGSLWVMYHLNTNMMPALVVFLIAAFFGLHRAGTWQVQRLGWKLDLIARVDQRVHAAPVAPRAQRLAAHHRRRRIPALRLRAVSSTTRDPGAGQTELGAGFWVLTPLQAGRRQLSCWSTAASCRPSSERPARTAPEPKGESTVTGLLRLTEPAAASCARTTRRPTAGIRATCRPSPPRAAWARSRLLRRRRGGATTPGSGRCPHVARRGLTVHRLPQQPPGLRPHLVRPGADGAGRGRLSCGATSAAGGSADAAPSGQLPPIHASSAAARRD